jgi:hypothetical protein
MSAYLAPIDKPKGLMLKLLYWFVRRQFGKVTGWLTVSSEHLFNINNIGLGIGSDGLCEISRRPQPASSRP